MMACHEDHDITILCVEIKEDEIGCELATIDGNRGLALSPVALGESYRRLHSLAGWSLERIAQRENKSPTTISSLIRLTTCSVVIKKWIHADAISYVNVLSLIDELGETEAISRIKKMIAELEQADANGITVKKPNMVRYESDLQTSSQHGFRRLLPQSRRRRQTHHHQLITETGGY
jgi:hypothetical protein